MALNCWCEARARGSSGVEGKELLFCSPGLGWGGGVRVLRQCGVLVCAAGWLYGGVWLLVLLLGGKQLLRGL